MGLSSMKVHQFARGGALWGDDEYSSSGLSLGVCKRLRPLNPKLTSSSSSETCFTMNNISVSNNSSSSNSHAATGAFDLRSFIRPESSPIQLVSPEHKKDSPQVHILNCLYVMFHAYYITCHKKKARLSLMYVHVR